MFKVDVGEEGKAKITGSLTIACVNEMHEELSDIFNNSSCTVLDCSGVTEIDTAALQLLIAFRRSLLELNSGIEFILGPAMDEAISILGIGKLFKVA